MAGRTNLLQLSLKLPNPLVLVEYLPSKVFSDLVAFRRAPFALLEELPVLFHQSIIPDLRLVEGLLLSLISATIGASESGTCTSAGGKGVATGSLTQA